METWGVKVKEGLIFRVKSAFSISRSRQMADRSR